MRNSKSVFTLGFAIAAFTLSLPVRAQAQQTKPQEKVLVSFSATGPAGNQPAGDLIRDAAGNFYGTTYAGGLPGGVGTVFEVSPTANGGWKAKSIYLFHPLRDGLYPGGGLVMDSSGNLYGTTEQGGTHSCTDGYTQYSCGTVFELSPNGSGGWSEKVIYNFSQESGWYPVNSMVMDASGNLYGTTDFVGRVFELQRNGEQWTYTVLHTFNQIGDGAGLSGPLVFDKAGNLYGETWTGGELNGGTVFKLTNTGNGWKEDILFNFDGQGSLASGTEPNGGLIFDSAGNLYGSTFAGGIGAAGGCGTVFELTPASGTWNQTVLHKFLCSPNGQASPEAGLAFDSAGNLYGTTAFGGSASSGTVFELKPAENGAWTYSVIHTFQGSPSDGQTPASNLIFDSKGNLYGSTQFGGVGGGGTVFEITP